MQKAEEKAIDLFLLFLLIKALRLSLLVLINGIYRQGLYI